MPTDENQGRPACRSADFSAPELTREELRRIGDAVARAFSFSTPGTLLEALAVDPHRLYVYWRIDSRHRGLPPELALRVETRAATQELPVQGLRGGRLVHIASGGATACVTLGWRDRRNRFHELARARRLALPPAADDADGADAAAAAEEVAHAAAVRALGASPVRHDFGDSGAGTLPPAAAGADALRIEAEILIEGHVSPGAALTLYGQAVPLRPDGSFEMALPLAGGIWALAMLREPEMPAPAEPVLRAGRAEEPLLEVHAALHVHGFCRDAAALRALGIAAPVLPDGSFSCRRLLPRGAVILPQVRVAGN